MAYDKAFYIRVTEKQQEVVAAKAADEGISTSQWIRDAINEKASREPHDFEKRDNKAIQELMTRWMNRGDRG